MRTRVLTVAVAAIVVWSCASCSGGSSPSAAVLSPFAKKGFVDSTPHDAASILALIEHRWQLAPVGTRDQAAADLENAFDFTR